MVGAMLLPSGPPVFIAPAFEKGTLEQFMRIKGEVVTWEEHESPYGLPAQIIGQSSGTLALDEATPFFVSNGIALASPAQTLITSTARASPRPAAWLNRKANLP